MKQGAGPLVRRVLLLVFVSLVSWLAGISAVYAQATAAGVNGPGMSRVDVFVGYSAFYPFLSDINLVKYQSTNTGATANGAYYLNRFLGVQAEGTFFPKGSDDNNCVFTGQAGPVARLPRGRFVPFFHALAGGAEVGGPANQPCAVWGYGFTTGLGIDYILPVLRNRLAVRPVQMDFLYSHINNGTGTTIYTGGIGKVDAIRYSGGIVFRFGHTEGALHIDPSLTCTAQPAEVDAGVPVVVMATAENLHTRHPLRYLWSTNGGTVKGTEAIEAVETKDLAPGEYVVADHLSELGSPHEIASCTTTFTVRQLEPPVVACRTDRAAIHAGDSVTISAVASSTRGRPLTYSYSATNGTVSGDTGTATLTTAGVTPGTITVTCKVTDDRGQSATATASTVVADPQVAAKAAALEPLCTLSFERDHQRPDRVDNEAKACLDDVALMLNREPAMHVLLNGGFTAGERRNNGAERALNAAQYLTDEKGIDPGRIVLRAHADTSRTVSTALVPEKAVAEEEPGDAVLPSEVERHGEPYGRRVHQP